MMTQSHFLVAAFLGDRLRRRLPVRVKALLVGSVAPDLPLLGLSFAYMAYRWWMGPLPGGEAFGHMYDVLYFEDPWWIAATSFFHAPLVVLAIAWVGHRAWKRGRAWGAILVWFAVGCGVHSLIDVVTHHDDGPVLLFPFEWHYRFPSPVSYWHPAHYGRIFSRFETLLDLAIVGYLALAWVLGRREPAPQASTVEAARLGGLVSEVEPTWER